LCLVVNVCVCLAIASSPYSLWKLANHATRFSCLLLDDELVERWNSADSLGTLEHISYLSLLSVCHSSSHVHTHTHTHTHTNTHTHTHIHHTHTHTLSLSQSFLMPLNRFLHTLLPPRSELSPFRAPPTLRRFSTPAFLHSLSALPPPTSSMRTSFPDTLYRVFLNSPNFVSWHSARRRTADKHLYQQYVAQLLSSSLCAQLPSMQEVELVDLYLRVREELAAPSRLRAHGKAHTSAEQLRALLSRIIDSLPADLRHSLRRKAQLSVG
jgi:hypothetical protein